MEPGEHRPRTELPECLDGNQLSMGVTHNQMPAQGEVSLVHSNNSQGDLTVATTVDNVDQTVRVDPSDSDQRPDDGMTPVHTKNSIVNSLRPIS